MCLMGHERRQTLALIEALACRELCARAALVVPGYVLGVCGVCAPCAACAACPACAAAAAAAAAQPCCDCYRPALCPA